MEAEDDDLGNCSVGTVERDSHNTKGREKQGVHEKPHDDDVAEKHEHIHCLISPVGTRQCVQLPYSVPSAETKVNGAQIPHEPLQSWLRPIFTKPVVDRDGNEQARPSRVDCRRHFENRESFEEASSSNTKDRV